MRARLIRLLARMALDGSMFATLVLEAWLGPSRAWVVIGEMFCDQVAAGIKAPRASVSASSSASSSSSAGPTATASPPQKDTTMNDQSIRAAAEAAHEANRIFCAAHGDHSQRRWEDADPHQRESAIAGVRVALDGATPEQQHEAWMRDKLAAGWRFGLVKDAVAKTHPCLVPYAELPPMQRAKDELYQAVVRGMTAALSCAST